MSDNAQTKQSMEQNQWRPLVPNQGDTASPAAAAGAVSERFQPLYQAEDTNRDSDPFQPMIDDSVPSSGDPSGRPDQAGEKPNAATATTPPAPSEEEMLEKRKQEAYTQGFEQGKKEGYEAGLNEARQTVENINQIMLQMDNLWQTMVSRYEREILELVKRIAEKVIYGHAKMDHEIVKKAILKSFELIPDPIEATINVSTEDYEFIETAKEDLFEAVRSLKNVSIVSDPALGPGGCRVETRAGEVDADIETRLAAISKSIIEAADEMSDNQ